MVWPIVAIAAVVVIVVVLFVLSLASATRMGADDAAEMQALADLNRLKGPGGQPFFSGQEAVWDLAEKLEDPILGKDRPAEPATPRPPKPETRQR